MGPGIYPPGYGKYSGMTRVGGFSTPSPDDRPHAYSSSAQTPDSTEPIVGWRRWHVRQEGTQAWLAPMFQGESVWPVRHPMRAVCGKPQRFHESARPVGIAPHCDCGIHAYHHPWQMSVAAPFVMGSVFLWGRVFCHQHGYRAEYAYPKELWVHESLDAEIVRSLGEYGVPVHVIKSQSLPLSNIPPLFTINTSGNVGIGTASPAPSAQQALLQL